MKTKRPLFFLALFLMLGVYLQSIITFAVLPMVMVVLIGAGSLLIFKKSRWGAVVVVLAVMLMGYIIAATAQQWAVNYVGRIAPYVNGVSVTIKGVIVSDPTVRKTSYGEKTVFVFQAQEYQEQHVVGKLLVNAYGRREVAYGDQIVITGKMHRPFEYEDAGHFSYRAFLEHQYIYHILSVKKETALIKITSNQWSLQRFSFAIQKKLRRVIDKYLSPKEAGLIAAMTLGDRAHIPQHIRILFERTGTAHILAISGIHIGMVVFLFMLVVGLFPMPRSVKFILVIVLLVGYVLMTGSRVSVIRASIMVSCLFLSLVFERESDSLNALGLAAMVIIMAHPAALFQVGFQLSFMSVVSILMILPYTERWSFLERGWPKRLKQSLMVSASAWLGTLGVVAYYFGIITPVAIVANLVIVPLMSVVVVLSFGMLATSFIPFLASSFAVCLKVTLSAMAACAYLFSHLPGAYVEWSMSLPQVLMYYGVLGAVMMSAWLLLGFVHKPKHQIDKKKQL